MVALLVRRKIKDALLSQCNEDGAVCELQHVKWRFNGRMSKIIFYVPKNCDKIFFVKNNSSIIAYDGILGKCTHQWQEGSDENTHCRMLRIRKGNEMRVMNPDTDMQKGQYDFHYKLEFMPMQRSCLKLIFQIEMRMQYLSKKNWERFSFRDRICRKAFFCYGMTMKLAIFWDSLCKIAHKNIKCSCKQGWNIVEAWLNAR